MASNTPRTSEDQAEFAMPRHRVEALVEVTRQLVRASDLQAILELICRAVVDIAEFEVAAITLVAESGDLEVVAVDGPPGVSEAVLGTARSRQHWEERFASSVPWHGLMFNAVEDRTPRRGYWEFDDPDWFERAKGHPDVWKAEYSLFVKLSDPSGELLGVLAVDMPRAGILPDVTLATAIEILARQAESAIASSRLLARTQLEEQVYRLTFDSGPTMTALAERNGSLIDTNVAFGQAFGPIVHAREFDELVVVDDEVSGLAGALKQVFSGADDIVTFVAREERSSAPRWFRVTVRAITVQPARAVCTIVDISAERREQQRHRHDAEHDPLTGLLNRRGARRMLEGPPDPGDTRRIVAVLAGDLDGFKAANDRFGHHLGDAILVETAERLRAEMPAGSAVIRLGGDEYLLVTRCHETAEVEALATRLTAVMQRPFDPEGQPLTVTMSLGVAAADIDDVSSIGVLVGAADQALYEAKSAGRARWVAAQPLA